jgi:glycosyltransferase involved in cell wall biosynthesis
MFFVLPPGIDDPRTPSGGNRYDRRVIDELRAQGHEVIESSLADLARAPSGATVLHDGLIACAVPGAVDPRFRNVVLVHLPMETEVERAALHAADAVVATSSRIGAGLVERYGLPAAKVHVAAPGVDPAPESSGPFHRLLCVAAVIPRKGHDVLLAALDRLGDLDDTGWSLTCAGALDRDPPFVAGLPKHPRVGFAGPVVGEGLDALYAGAGVLVLPSRAEPYGMVVTEALIRGIPVIATDVDGIPEALGVADGRRPGILMPPGDPAALAAALRVWLSDATTREHLRAAARGRRSTLRPWSDTARTLAEVLRDPTDPTTGGGPR